LTNLEPSFSAIYVVCCSFAHNIGRRSVNFQALTVKFYIKLVKTLQTHVNMKILDAFPVFQINFQALTVEFNKKSVKRLENCLQLNFQCFKSIFKLW